MQEALNLFEEVANSRWFKNTSMILFMNKSDLFEEKIQKKSLKLCFPDFDAENTFAEGIEYIRKQFVERNLQKTKQVYSHVTCATNRGDVERVFNDVQHIVVNLSLHKGKGVFFLFVFSPPGSPPSNVCFAGGLL